MYKKFRILAFLFAILALGGCQKDLVLDGSTEDVITGTESLTLKQEGETKTLSLSTLSGDWTVEQDSYDSSWLTVFKQDGNLVVTAGKNTQADERQSQITLNVATGKKTILVTQFGSDAYISIEGSNGTQVYNHDGHPNEVLKVVSNSNNWRVDQVDGAQNDWLTYKADPANGTLTLALKPIERGSQWEQTSRSNKIFLSNGNKHFELTVIQNGFVQFQLPVWDLGDNFDLQRLTELETARGNSRNDDIEVTMLMPRGEKNDNHQKLYYVFRSPGEQAPNIFYYQDYYNDYKISQAFLKAPEGKKFNEASLTPWLEQNNFIVANAQTNETESEYYCEEEEKTKLIHIYNDPDNDKVHSGTYKSACMRYVETSNEMKLDANGRISSFPVGSSLHLHDKNFKLKEIVAYEKTRGMIPDYNNTLNSEGVTKATSDPECPYSVLLFASEKPSDVDGSLLYTIYFFNWKGVTAEDKDLGLTDDPNLNGTAGSFRAFYKGVSLFYSRTWVGNNIYGYWANRISTQTTVALQDKGYKLARSGDGLVDLTTFVRGKQDLIDIQPQSERTVITYYKSERYVNIINGTDK